MDGVVGTFEKWDLNFLSFSLHTNVPWKEKYAVESQILSHLTRIPLLYLLNMTHQSPSPQTIQCQSQLQNASEKTGSNCKKEKTYNECQGLPKCLRYHYIHCLSLTDSVYHTLLLQCCWLLLNSEQSLIYIKNELC